MKKNRKVDDSQLEQVTGGGGVMDPPGSQTLQESGSGSENQDVAEAGHDLGNDMILTQTDRD